MGVGGSLLQDALSKVYEEIKRQVGERAGERAGISPWSSSGWRPTLADARVKAKVTGRPKHYYSVYQMMMVGRAPGPSTIFTISSRCGCWWTPAATVMPRSGRCMRDEAHCRALQGLHRDAQVQYVPVFAHDGDWAERAAGGIQIRTWDMHRRAEYAGWPHWKYKNKSTGRNELASETGRLPICGGSNIARLAGDRGSHRLPRLPCAMRSMPVRCMSSRPRAMSSPSPAGSCPIDFAYAVHTGSDTAPSVRASTAAWCRWSHRWRTATWSRCFHLKAEGAGPS